MQSVNQLQSIIIYNNKTNKLKAACFVQNDEVASADAGYHSGYVSIGLEQRKDFADFQLLALRWLR